MQQYKPIGEIARRLGITAVSVRRMAERGLFDYITVPNEQRSMWLIDVESFERFLESCKPKSVERKPVGRPRSVVNFT